MWLFLKERFLAHRLHAEYEAIVDAETSEGSKDMLDQGNLHRRVSQGGASLGTGDLCHMGGDARHIG